MGKALDLRVMLTEARSPYTYGATSDKVRTLLRPSTTPSKPHKVLNKLEVNYLYDSKFFTDSDLLLVKIVANSVFATLPMIGKALVQLHKTTQGLALIKETKYLKARLKKLVEAQMLSKYVFHVPQYDSIGRGDTDDDDDVTLSYYVVTPHGYNYIKRILYFSENYDEYISIAPLEEVFKYLSTATICQGFFNINGYSKYSVDKPYYSQRLKKKDKIFGVVSLKRPDSTNYKIIVEPIKFAFNTARVTKDVWDNLITERFELLSDYLATSTDYNEGNTRIIFACEDMTAIQRTAMLAAEHLPNYLDEVYFTIDILVQNYGFENTCIGLNTNSDMVAVVPDFLV